MIRYLDLIYKTHLNIHWEIWTCSHRDGAETLLLNKKERRGMTGWPLSLILST